MRKAVAEGGGRQLLVGLFWVGEDMERLRQHHIFKGREIRHEMKLLENEADFFGAVTHQFAFAEFRKVHAVDDHVTGSQRIQAAENVDERGLPRAGRPHKRDPFAEDDSETDAVERTQRTVLLDQVVDDHLLRRDSRLRLSDGTHASPPKTAPAPILPSRRSGNALRIATSMVSPTATGYTISRGCAATPKTAFPSPIERKMPATAPSKPPASPISAASARNSRSTRRVAPPMAFIKPTSIFRSIATFVIAAITHSPVSNSTMPTVAVSNPLMRL